MRIQKKTFLSLALALLSAVPGASRLSAAIVDKFEQAYGHDKYFEQALKGAVPVQVCPGGGYVSAGFSRPTDARTDSDVYVVRVGENGSAVWQRTIDVDHFSDDVGTSVRELHHGSSGGFMVTGTTAPAIGSDRDVFLLKLDCDGSLAWVQRLRTQSDLDGASTDDVANDVIEADTGAFEPIGSPRQGDLIVAGSSRQLLVSKVFDTDAYLVRTDPQGNVIWSRTYSNWGGGSVDDHPIDQEWFNAVSEALPTSDQTVGDVLAAGAQADTGWKDGLAVRVDGTNGLMTLPLHTMASFNDPDAGPLPQERLTELWAIRELRQLPELLNIVVVGNIAEAGGTAEGYTAKTGPSLNLLLAERVIGDGFSGSGDEGFADVQEIFAPTSYASAGDLAVAGYATVSGNQDVAMLALSPGALTPVAGTGRLFGDHSGGEERGTALAQVQESGEFVRFPGFYVNGFTRSDPRLAGDPEDMYLIKTNGSGHTNCSIVWTPSDFSDEHGFCECGPQMQDPGTTNEAVSSSHEKPEWGGSICQ
ncbi:MAG TPA: hypothetical protein VF173_37470 [Thermoanaerobaculia bacterium]|nr:hypothetical protein [Thermoanaerobaculia bacterium]